MTRTVSMGFLGGPRLSAVSFSCFLLLAFLRVGEAACPNACSGNGICGEYDSCICYSNFQGGDCSERVCLSNWAWVTSPQGDLNMDGDLYDSTQYSDDYRFLSSAFYLQTDASPGGTWEYWPSFASSASDEGHFYMECSNKGLCDRQTGQCQCFPGYEGEACRRRSCPNACSGNGVCLAVNQHLADYNTESGSSRVYTLWDGDMSRSCKCDPGYTGVDCSERVCPHGDDPMTTEFQINEMQWVEIYSTLATASVTDGLAGKASFTFTDHNGGKWTTDPVTIQHYDSSTAADQMATDLEAALEALPNDVLKDVIVTAGHCETVLPGKFLGFDAGSAVADGYNSGTNPSGFLHCPTAVGNSLTQGHLVVDASGPTVYLNSYIGSGSVTHALTAIAGTPSTTSAVDATCNLIAYPECVRFKIEFVENPGALTDLTVDISAVTLNQKTMSQDPTVVITSSVTDELEIVTDATALFGYAYTVDETVSSSDQQGTITPSTKTITFGTASTTGVTFAANSRIALYCTETSQVYMGEYTVSATTTAGADIIVNEAISAPNGNCGSAGDGTVMVQKVTHYIDTNVDLTNEDLTGYAVELSHFLTENPAQKIEQVVGSVQYVAAGEAHIFLADTTSLTADVSSANGKLKVYGKGTKENAECGDRGLCNTASGVCQCFRGYTGNSCGVQDALA